MKHGYRVIEFAKLGREDIQYFYKVERYYEGLWCLWAEEVFTTLEEAKACIKKAIKRKELIEKLRTIPEKTVYEC